MLRFSCFIYTKAYGTTARERHDSIFPNTIVSIFLTEDAETEKRDKTCRSTLIYPFSTYPVNFDKMDDWIRCAHPDRSSLTSNPLSDISRNEVYQNGCMWSVNVSDCSDIIMTVPTPRRELRSSSQGFLAVWSLTNLSKLIKWTTDNILTIMNHAIKQ